MCFFMLNFHCKFFALDVLQRFEEFITTINVTGIINNSYCCITFFRLWWSKQYVSDFAVLEIDWQIKSFGCPVY